jgi:hypothetical protein
MSGIENNSFRLRGLPQELRDRIFEYALEPRAIFWHVHYNRREPTFSLPNLSFWKSGYIIVVSSGASSAKDVQMRTTWIIIARTQIL